MAYNRIGRPRKADQIQQEFDEMKDPDLAVAEQFEDNKPVYEEPIKEIIKPKEIKDIKCICIRDCWISTIPLMFTVGETYEFPEDSIPKYFKKIEE